MVLLLSLKENSNRNKSIKEYLDSRYFTNIYLFLHQNLAEKYSFNLYKITHEKGDTCFKYPSVSTFNIYQCQH